MLIAAITLTLLVLSVVQCTKIELLYPGFLKKTEYDNYPYLKDGVESEHYRIEYISNPYAAFVTYDTEHDYFFMAQAPFRRIDRSGIGEFVLEQGKFLDHPRFSHYVFDREGVFDFSETTVRHQVFIKTLNDDGLLKGRERDADFSRYYNKADVVVYGVNREFDYPPAYLKIDGTWLRFMMGTYDGLVDDHYNAISYEKFPAKFKKMVLLRASHHGRLSNGQGNGAPLGHSVKKSTWAYPNGYNINSLYFEKSFVSENFPYTPIPAEFTGTAYYRIRIGDDVLKFKESALKSTLSFNFESFLYWYLPPRPYVDNTSVSFVELRYPHNLNESGSNGVYVIVRK